MCTRLYNRERLFYIFCKYIKYITLKYCLEVSINIINEWNILISGFRGMNYNGLRRPKIQIFDILSQMNSWNVHNMYGGNGFFLQFVEYLQNSNLYSTRLVWVLFLMTGLVKIVVNYFTQKEIFLSLHWMDVDMSKWYEKRIWKA